MSLVLSAFFILFIYPAQAVKMDGYRLSQNVERQVDPGPVWIEKNCPKCEIQESEDIVKTLLHPEGEKIKSRSYVISSRELKIAFSNHTDDEFKVIIMDRADASAGPFCHDLFPGYKTLKKSHRYYREMYFAVKTMTCRRDSDILKKMIKFLSGEDRHFCED